MSISEGEGRNSIKVFLITLIILFCTVKTNVFANSLYQRWGSGKLIFVNMPCMANVYVEAYELSLNNKVIGYIGNPDTVETVLNKIKQTYIDKASEKGVLVKEVNFDTKIDLKKNMIQSKDLSSVEDITSKIMLANDILEEPLLDVTIEAEIDEIASIEPAVEVIKLEDKYLGENTIEEGKWGEKKVKKKVTFINGKESESEIISESVLKEAESTKIYKGIKNPINSNMAFLAHPTRGGVITSVFGEKSRGGHRGVDIAVPSGTPIGAACDGVVSFVGYDDIYGNMVKIKHDDNTETLYAHASYILTELGKEVKKGETIAKVGSTGRSTGPHLHLELIYKGNPINPVDYIS